MKRGDVAAMVVGLAALALATAGHAQYGVPPVMLPIPPVPKVGGYTWLHVSDPTPAHPGTGPYVYVYDVAKKHIVRSGGLWVSGRIIVDLSGLPAGKYRAEYFDLGAPPSPADEPKLAVEFFVSRDGPVPVVEYYNASLDHYFITADPAEMARLDSGDLPGWTRTGESFNAIATDEMPSYATPVCRFYGLPEFGLDSHFFAATPAECVGVQATWPDRWKLESPAAFGVLTGIFPVDCGDTMRHVYRLYDNRPDANHRYTVSPEIRDAMIARGWILEAYDHAPWEEPYTMCVPL